MKVKSGGGLTSNKLKQSKAPKVEPKPRAVSPAAAAQLGAAVQFKKPNLQQGKGYSQGPMGPTGVRGTFNSASQGPGSGRYVHPSGSQSATPAPKEMPKGRDTLSEFGRDIPGRK
jgi:hypothetical protein